MIKLPKCVCEKSINKWGNWGTRRTRTRRGDGEIEPFVAELERRGIILVRALSAEAGQRGHNYSLIGSYVVKGRNKGD